MRIEKKIRDYLIFSGDSIIDALKRINDNKSRIIFVVEDSGVLIGAISDGDLRRWITGTSDLDLNASVDQVMNGDFTACNIKDSHDDIAKKFNHAREIIPLVDELGRFVAIARRSEVGFQIGNFLLSEDAPAFIIAEVGNNHQGDIALAKELVDRAIEARADCVKFQMRDLSSLYSNKGKDANLEYDLGSQYTLDLLNKFQLNNDQLCEIFDYCYMRGILPLCTPWDLVSAKILNEYGLEAFKIASADLTNYELLEFLAKTDKPLICSTGMSRESEIKGSISLLKSLGVQFAMLHCNSTYPTPFKDVNLNYLPRLKQLSGSIVGYSGHERGYAITLASVAMGARIIEKHLTVNRKLEGNDHKVSLLPNEFAEMVQQIRNVEEAMGCADTRDLTQGELINRENLAKSLMINCELHEGETIQRHMILVKSPGQGLQPNRMQDLVGKKALRNFNAGDFFFEADLIPRPPKKSHYLFKRPYGIPVRYHDFKDLVDGMNIDFVEFHLSYHDLDINLDDFFDDEISMGYAVHSPELFSGDHILDLASDDDQFWERSIAELNRTVATTIKLNKYFPTTENPVLVLNAGGWTQNGFLPIEKRAKMYQRIEKALERIEFGPVKLAIQTMPPFPWHFGGQSYHNLFVDPDEIIQFCKKTGHYVCLDVSHSMMACNYFKWDMSEFLRKVLPYSIHLHIVDAKGVDGEGIQIGVGDVDFRVLAELLNKYSPGVQFIPEVWQGHKNKGEGFWSALGFLEKLGF